jgi:fibronectin type 3 domain-containing protein
MVSSSAWAQIQINACDLNADGVVNSADVTLAVNMDIGTAACTADIIAIDTCNVVVVQRVINAIPPGTCVTAGNAHTVTLSWTASTTPNVSYNIYRSATSNGTYTKIGSVGVGVLSYTDSTALAGETYFYVATAVDSSNNESVYSAPPVQATVPFP